MALQDVYNLANITAFGQRCRAAIFNYCLNTIQQEVSNDVQTITVTGSPTGGSFTLGNGPLQSAEAPAWNATAQAVQALIQSGLAAGASCVCTGGPLPATPVVVTFTGSLAANPQNLMTVTLNSLTGGSSPNASVAHTNTGVSAVNHSARAAKATNILAGADLSQMYVAIANDATVQADYTGGGNLQTAVTDAHINAAVASAFNAFI